MPSEGVVEGYERLLRLRAGSLIAQWEAANVERHGDPWIRRRPHLPIRFPDPASPMPPNSLGAASGPLGESPWPRQPVADGSDPDAAGCSLDAITLNARRIAHSQRRIIIGQVELRYSARAGAMWGRFEGYGFLERLAEQRDDLQVVIEVLRHSDGVGISTKEQYCFDHLWSDLLVADRGTFQATATVRLGHEAIGAGATECLAPLAS